MGISDWIAVSLVGLGALMGTFGRNVIRITGVTLIVVSALGVTLSHYRQADAQNPSSGIGSNNTIVNVPPPASMGNGNTIIGPTDSHGNTIINQGGTAIGSGACANSTGIAIGAGARAGCSPQQPSPNK